MPEAGRPRADAAGVTGDGATGAYASAQQPVALLYGRGRQIVHANPAFVREFGACTGMPAEEALVDMPRIVFEVVDRAFDAGRPLATWVTIAGTRRRLTVAPRRDPESGEIYGVAVRLAAAPTVG